MSLTVRQLTELDPAADLGRAWEALVQANPASGLMQSLHWAAAKRRQGFRVLHLGLFEDGVLAGGALCYAAPPPQPAGLLVAPEGPVLPWTDEARARRGLRLLTEAAERAAADIGAVALRVEPRLAPPRPRPLRAFRRAPVDLLARETLYLDLTPPPAALLAQMRPKGRYNIRLAARHGVTVRAETTPEAVAPLYALLAETAQRDEFFLEPLAVFVALAEALGPPGIARVLLAEHDGETLAAMLLTTYGGRATYLYGGVANRRRHLMAGYALQWAAITAAQQAGCLIYDFYGYEPHGAPDHLYAGFSRFKRQFGGRPVQFIGAHDDYFLDHLADMVVQAVRETTPAGAGARPERRSDGFTAGRPVWAHPAGDDRAL